MHSPSPRIMLDPALLSVFNCSLCSPSRSLCLSVSNATRTDFPRVGWIVMECVLLAFTRGQEPGVSLPRGRWETSEIKRRMSWSRQGEAQIRQMNKMSHITLYFHHLGALFRLRQVQLSVLWSVKTIFLHLFSLFHYF